MGNSQSDTQRDKQAAGELMQSIAQMLPFPKPACQPCRSMDEHHAPETAGGEKDQAQKEKRHEDELRLR